MEKVVEKKTASEAVELLDRFAKFMNSCGRVAGELANASEQASELITQAKKVKESFGESYKDGRDTTTKTRKRKAKAKVPN